LFAILSISATLWVEEMTVGKGKFEQDLTVLVAKLSVTWMKTTSKTQQTEK
jgi:hypothetical protein